jgi:hypothetical protein
VCCFHNFTKLLINICFNVFPNSFGGFPHSVGSPKPVPRHAEKAQRQGADRPATGMDVRESWLLRPGAFFELTDKVKSENGKWLMVMLNSTKKCQDKQQDGTLYSHTRHGLKHRKRPAGNTIPIKNRIAIDQRINNRPREKLNFYSPKEISFLNLQNQVALRC